MSVVPLDLHTTISRQQRLMMNALRELERLNSDTKRSKVRASVQRSA
jgi:hypothetical protein